MSPYRWRVFLFRLRIMLLAVPIVLSALYYKWIAPRLWPAHAHRMRVAGPRTLAAALLWLSGIRTRIVGIEHLTNSANRPRVLMVNHNSRFDYYALLAVLDFPFKGFWSNTAHVTTERFGLLEWFGRAFDLFFVHDKSNARRTLQEFKKAESYVAKGGTLSLFPEGTFSADGTVRSFGDSCVTLAIRTNALIVPIVMFGSQATFEKPENGHKHIVIHIMPPISTAGRDRLEVPALVASITGLMNTELLRMHSAYATDRHVKNAPHG